MRSPLALAIRVFLALLLVAALAGCDLLDPLAASEGAGNEGVDFSDLDAQQLEPGQQLAVPLQIQEGANGGLLAFVPVYFGEHGPYSFALDTGASHSVIDETVVQEIALPLTGETRPLTGIAGVAEAEHVKVDAWRVGDVALPPLEVASLRLAAGSDATLRGLIGSDILSDFDRITIDFVQEQLLLQPRQS